MGHGELGDGQTITMTRIMWSAESNPQLRISSFRRLAENERKQESFTRHSLMRSIVTALDCVIGMILMSTARLISCHLIAIAFKRQIKFSLCEFRKLVATIASLSSLSVFRNDLLSSGSANQISSRLGVGTEQRRKPVSIADGCFRFV